MTKKYEVDWFYHYANEYRKHLTEETEIEKLQVTDEFYEALWTIKQEGGIIKININAPPYSGKSLTAFALANECMKHTYKRKMKISDIDRDQIEYGLTIRNKNINHTVRVVDEINVMSQTGEGATVEEALESYFSDVMAQREIDIITCSPTGTTDKNTLIFLEVFSTDKIKKINHCKLFYRINTGGIEYKQLLGIVSIDVSEILKESWYKEYRKRKFEKMDMILVEGVFQPRKLIYAEVVLNIVEKYKPCIEIGVRVTMNMVRSTVKSELSKNKMPQSLILLGESSNDTMAILEAYKEYYRIKKQININKKELAKPEVQTDTALATTLRNQNIMLMKASETIHQAAEELEQELQRLKKINQKYKLKEEKGDEINGTNRKRI